MELHFFLTYVLQKLLMGNIYVLSCQILHCVYQLVANLVSENH